MQSTIQLDEVDKIIDGIGCEEKNIISILQGVQEHYRYLPKEVFPHIAKRLGVGEARLFSVATFYENFSLEPKGKFVIKVCDGTACHVRQSPPILARLRQELGLSETKKNHRRPDVHRGNSLLPRRMRTCPGHHRQRPRSRGNDPG